MAKISQSDILKMIEGLSTEEQIKLIESLKQDAGDGKKKFRRKKKQQPKEEVKKPEPPTPKKKVKRKEFVNEFEDSPLFHANKQDAEVDKKLWGNRQPTERGGRSNGLINVKCARCGKQEQVQKSLVFRSRDEHGQLEEAIYYCNKCCTTRR